MSIWNYLVEPYREAVEMAFDAYNDGTLPIGAVITNADGKTVARGKSRTFAAAGNIMCSHAEMNAISIMSIVELQNPLDIWVTTEPCPMCFGTIAVSRIRTLYFASYDSWSGSTDLADGNFYLRWKPLKIIGPMARSALPEDNDFTHAMQILLAYGMIRYVPLEHEIFTRMEEIVLPKVRKMIPEMLANKHIAEAIADNKYESFLEMLAGIHSDYYDNVH